MTLEESFEEIRKALSPVPVSSIVYEYDPAVREKVARVFVADDLILALLNGDMGKFALAAENSGLNINPMPASWIGRTIEYDETELDPKNPNPP